jgi:hypothetical protein
MKLVRTNEESKDAGFPKEANDCTVTAFRHAFGLEYGQARAFLYGTGRDYGEGYTFYRLLNGLKASEIAINGRRIGAIIDLPYKGEGVREFIDNTPTGIWLIGTRNHIFALVDGVVYDTAMSYQKNYRIQHIYQIVLDKD